MFSFNINDIYDAIPYHDRTVPFLKQSPKSLLMLLLMIGGNVQLNPGPQNVKKKNHKEKCYSKHFEDKKFECFNLKGMHFVHLNA